jgi:hypothetical protein
MCISDELALEYQYAFELADQILEKSLITKNEYERLKQIADIFTRMSDGSHPDFWTLEGLNYGAKWAEIRRLASDLRSELAPTSTPPDFGWLRP